MVPISKRLGGHGLHALHQVLDRTCWFTRCGKNRCVAIRLNLEAENGDCTVCFRLQFCAVVEVEVAHAGRGLHIHLASGDVVTGAIDDGPYSLIFERPTARVHAIVVHGI